MSDNNLRVTRRGALAGAAGVAFATAMGGRIMPALAAAPKQGTLRPSIYRFSLGEFEVTTLLDGTVIGDPTRIFGQNASPEEVREHAEANLLPGDQLENPFTVTLVNTGEQLILFDTGNGAGRRPDAGHLLERLQEAGYTPDQVDLVVITHGHPDHINGLVEDGQPTFPNAQYMVGEVEHQAWKSGDGIPEGRQENRQLYMNVVVPFEDRMTFLKPDDEVASGIRAVNAFGHAPGMLGFHLESGGRQLLIWADTANHYVLSVQKPEWHVSFDHDKEAGVETRKRIFDMVATDRIPVIGYHLPPPAVGYVVQWNGGYRWEPVSYQLNL
jgi:glyoxylase-like metal-dependent hydrolase (beta-lactamase superfamily II)